MTDIFRVVSKETVVRKKGLLLRLMISVWPLLDHRVSGGVTQLTDTKVLGASPKLFLGRSVQAEELRNREG